MMWKSRARKITINQLPPVDEVEEVNDHPKSGRWIITLEFLDFVS